MAAGLPVVVTKTGGMLEAVETEPIGFMVPPGDIEALQDKIKLLCTDDEHRKIMGENARTYVQQTHSFDAISDQLESLYERVIVESEQ